VFFITFALTALFFKLLVLDAYSKEETEREMSCSLFFADFLPQFFVCLSLLMVAAKAVNLVLIVKYDKETTHTKNSKARGFKFTRILIPVYIILFTLTCIRYIDTCHYHREGNWVIAIAREVFTTNKLMSMIYSFKMFNLVLVLGCLVLMRDNPYLTEARRIYFGFLAVTTLIAINIAVFIPVIALRLIDLKSKGFLTLFFNDLFLLALLTFLVLHLRATEMKVLVDMGVYKNIDMMNDRELF
jgi:hypothetical protein